jgi:4'-phosphopantetheinyl transferase
VRTGGDHHSVAVYFADLKASAALLDVAERETPRLASDEIARWTNLVQSRGADDAMLWRASHIALRIAIEHIAGSKHRTELYTSASGGRPSLAVGAPHFSLAHTGDVALIAVSRSGLIGTDIEAPRSLKFTDDRRQKIEAAALRLAPDLPLPHDGDARTLQAWVRLEAHAKATGAGIGAALTDAGVIGGGTDLRSPSPSDQNLAVMDLAVPGGYFAAVSAATLPVSLKALTFPVNTVQLQAFLAP